MTYESDRKLRSRTTDEVYGMNPDFLFPPPSITDQPTHPMSQRQTYIIFKA